MTCVVDRAAGTCCVDGVAYAVRSIACDDGVRLHVRRARPPYARLGVAVREASGRRWLFDARTAWAQATCRTGHLAAIAEAWLADADTAAATGATRAGEQGR